MKTFLFFLFLGIAASVNAQPVTGTNELTLDQAIGMALEHNYTTRTASNDLLVSQYDRTKAGDNLLPTALATANYGYNHSLTTEFDFLGQPVNPNSHSLRYNVGANFNIYNGGFDASNINSAEYSLEAAKYNLKWVRQQIAFDVVSAYINALRTKELLVSAEKTLAESNAQVERIKGLYSAGSVPVGQVYQQEALVGQQEVQSIQARNNYLNAKADLLYLLNIAPDSYGNYDVTLIGIDTSVASLHSKQTSVQSTPSLMTSVLEHREDFLAQRSSILASEAAIGLTRSRLYPSLGASIGIGGSGSDAKIQKIQLFHALTGGLNLSIPIYDASQNRLQIDIQEVQIKTSQIRLEQAEQGFRSEVAKAENNLRSSEQALGATERSLKAAEESLRSALERLKVGAGIQLDVIVAEAQVQTARTDRINAVYNYLLSTKQLEYLLGKTTY